MRSGPSSTMQANKKAKSAADDAELARTQRDVEDVVQRLQPLEATPLSERTDDVKAEIQQLRDKEKQLRDKEMQLLNKEMLMLQLERARSARPHQPAVLVERSSPSKEVVGLYDAILNCNVSASKSMVPPPGGLPWFCGLETGQSLYVRECYAWFYEKAKASMASLPGLIYTGNPGIGKSAWLNYAVVRFVQDGFAVLLERADEKDYFVFSDGKCMHRGKPVQQSAVEDLPPNAVYLFDPDENDSRPLGCQVFTIVASSPQLKHYKKLKKRGASVCYFPCWELDELVAVKPPGLNDHTVQERVVQWGGIPRFVFLADQERLYTELRKAITGMDLKLVAKYLNTPEISEEDQRTISHMVVQYRIITPTYSCCELDFASTAIGRAVVEAKGQADYGELIGHYELMRRTSKQAIYVGHLWDHLCHMILPRGTESGFLVEGLSGQSARRIFKKQIPVECGNADTMAKVVKAGKYFQPTASNFPVIDAAIMEEGTFYGLQMTVASSPPSKAGHAAKLLEKMPSLQLVWVVDSQQKDHIKAAQSFDNSTNPVDQPTLDKLLKVPQWLLALEFPKTNPFMENMNPH